MSCDRLIGLAYLPQAFVRSIPDEDNGIERRPNKNPRTRAIRRMSTKVFIGLSPAVDNAIEWAREAVTWAQGTAIKRLNDVRVKGPVPPPIRVLSD